MDVKKTDISGRIFNIQHFCTDDGPGIRTTVFLKGCPLKCAWCHNPESWKVTEEIMFYSGRCISCGKCLSVCENGAHSLDGGSHMYRRDLCILCSACTDQCPTHALEAVGMMLTVSEVMHELLCDRAFYASSGGGVTLSGGEPTFQHDFTEALLRACKAEGLHTCLETCLFTTEDTVKKLAPLVDIFLVDWKISDPELHRQYTGVSNEVILKNLCLLDSLGAKIILRCPLIPHVNLCSWHFDGIIELANRHSCIRQIDLEPYHPIGINKSLALGKVPDYDFDGFLEADAAENAKKYIQSAVSIPVCFLSV